MVVMFNGFNFTVTAQDEFNNSNELCGNGALYEHRQYG